MLEFRDILEYPGHRVFSNGAVESRWKRAVLTDFWHTLSSSPRGYVRVSLYKDGNWVTMYAHQLVLTAFVGPCPDGMECRHLDGNQRNNNLWNICWGTKEENEADRVRHGTDSRGERNGRAILNEGIVLEIRRATGTTAEIAKIFHIPRYTVNSIRNDITWKHLLPTKEIS